jgi:hypothetical protein
MVLRRPHCYFEVGRSETLWLTRLSAFWLSYRWDVDGNGGSCSRYLGCLRRWQSLAHAAPSRTPQGPRYGSRGGRARGFDPRSSGGSLLPTILIPKHFSPFVVGPTESTGSRSVMMRHFPHRKKSGSGSPTMLRQYTGPQRNQSRRTRGCLLPPAHACRRRARQRENDSGEQQRVGKVVDPLHLSSDTRFD